VLVERAFIHKEHLDGRRTWPFDVPAVRQLSESGLVFEAPVTFLVGENGSGKSTIVEAVAEAFGLDARGGRAGRKYANDRPKTELGSLLSLDLTLAGLRMKQAARNKQKGFFLRAETAYGLLEAVNGLPGYWTSDVTRMSHGEGFLTVFEEMFAAPGLYLMDEPEAALSFSSCLQLVALMHRLGEVGAQVICATHSPVLASTPGADILELDDSGFRRTTWGELALVDHWRRYLAEPGLYLHHLIPEA
jgi:predicted ATPase